jgi:hypothetical protein
MAHFAELDSTGIVLRIVVLSNAAIDNLPFPQSEPVGISFLKDTYGQDTYWAQTSYNANFRYNFAGVGMQFDEVNQAFYTQSPYASWVLNKTTYQYDPPVPYPDDGQFYTWDEEIQNWVLFSPPPEVPVKVARVKTKSTIA